MPVMRVQIVAIDKQSESVEDVKEPGFRVKSGRLTTNSTQMKEGLVQFWHRIELSASQLSEWYLGRTGTRLSRLRSQRYAATEGL